MEKNKPGGDQENKHNKNPIERANCFSRFIINWARHYVKISKTKPWEQHMYKPLAKIDTVEFNRPKFEKIYLKKKSIWKTGFTLYKGKVIEFLMSMIIIATIEYSTAFFLSNIVKEIELGTENLKKRLDYITWNFVLIILALLLAPVIRQYYYFQCYRLGYRIKGALLSMCTSKILNFSVLNSTVHSEGKILNYIQIDIMRVESVTLQLYGVIYFGFNILFGLFLAYFMIDNAIFGILGMTLLMNLAYLLVYKYRSRVTKVLMRNKDDRISFIKQVMKNLQYIKLNCFENFYIWKIYHKRQEEIRRLRQFAIATAWGFFVEWLTPGMTQLALSLYYIYLKPENFNFAEFSAFLQIFEVIKRSTMVMNVWLNRFVEMMVSIKRLNSFLAADNINLSYITEPESGKDIALQIKNGRFVWGDNNLKLLKNENSTANTKSQVLQKDESKKINGKRTEIEEEFELKNIDFEVKKGERVFIIGKSSSGKSSLLYSILGEMTPKHAKVEVKRSGKVVFLAQDQWTFAETVKENITFGKEYSEERLNKCLEMAQMSEDIKTMNQGLDTLLGDTGHTVSGGQRARVGLARCFYQEGDIYLFDDPLSALDLEVASRLLNTIVEGELKGKTFLFSTNNQGYLKYADKILYLEEGDLKFTGSYQEFQESEFWAKYEFVGKENEANEGKADLEVAMKKLEASEKKEQELNQKSGEKSPKIENENRKCTKKPEKKLFLKEDRSRGAVSLTIFKRMIEALGGNWIAFIIILMTMLTMSILIFFTLFSVQWGEKFRDKEDTIPTLTIIVGMAGMAAIGMAFRSLVIYRKSALMSKRIHAKMAFKTVHAKITEFMQRVPLGLLLNRFSHDVDIMDKRIPLLISYVALEFFLVIVDLIAVIIGADTFLLLIPCFIYVVLGWWYRTRYMNAKREVMRLYSITKSPISGWGEAIVKGSTVLRNLDREKYCVDKMDLLIHENNKNLITKDGLDGWFNNRVSIWGWLIVLVPAYIYVILQFRNSEDIKYENLILLVIRTGSLAGDFQLFVTDSAEMENQMIAIERCKWFEDIQPEENYTDLEIDEKEYEIHKKKKFDMKDKERWGNKNIFKLGKIEVKDLVAKYPTRDKPILNGVTVEFKPGEKIGIIGRTGAGKTSFIKLFSRILVPSSGSIIIDGVDISKINLKILRDQIMTLSQDSSLFEGTLRENIDPYMTDEKEIAKVKGLLLELGLDNQSLVKKGLEMEVEPEGGNLSQGEKQIISFVRALHNRRRVVIFDEATSNLDMKTEELFQAKTEEYFKDSTMMIIAHRIQTVMNCDKILVFDDGKVAEFDSPENLRKDPESVFSKLCEKL